VKLTLNIQRNRMESETFHGLLYTCCFMVDHSGLDLTASSARLSLVADRDPIVEDAGLDFLRLAPFCVTTTFYHTRDLDSHSTTAVFCFVCTCTVVLAIVEDEDLSYSSTVGDASWTRKAPSISIK